MTKFLPILIIFIGEAVTISAEIFAARQYGTLGNSFYGIIFRVFPFMFIGCLALLVGYMLGLEKFKNIWTVSAISVSSIILIEPIVAYGITNQLPTRGGLIGFILGALGLLAALFL